MDESMDESIDAYMDTHSKTTTTTTRLVFYIAPFSHRHGLTLSHVAIVSNETSGSRWFTTSYGSHDDRIILL